jgi:NAD(P)-dependent dehydrogenase (short-subunit alcohol dehydrogenase family)
MDEATHRAYREPVATLLPLGRIGTPEEAAHPALPRRNTFTTGITPDVDGGQR